MTQDIDNADLLLSGLLQYFQVAAPIRKADTLNALIQEVLEKNKAQAEEKGAQLFKRLEEKLPEIIVPDEQLKYILNFVLQYVILSTPPKGNIQFLTSSFIFPKDSGGTQAFFERYGGWIEISIVFSGDREPMEQVGAAWARITAPQKDKALEFILGLVKGMVMKNWGKMNVETDEKKKRTILSLKFPMERRKAVFANPIVQTHPPAILSPE